MKTMIVSMVFAVFVIAGSGAEADVRWDGALCTVPTAVVGFDPPIGEPEPDTYPRVYLLDRIVTTAFFTDFAQYVDSAVDLFTDIRGTFTMFSAESGSYDVTFCVQEDVCITSTDRFLIRRSDVEGNVFRVTSQENRGDYWVSSLVWDDRFGLMAFLPICDETLFFQDLDCDFPCDGPNCLECPTEPPVEEPPVEEPPVAPFA